MKRKRPESTVTAAAGSAAGTSSKDRPWTYETSVDVARILSGYEARAHSLTGLEVLEALEWYGRARRVAPTWLVEAFANRLARYTVFEVRSLDEAFDAKRTKGLKLIAARQKLLLKNAAHDLFKQVRASGDVKSAEEADLTVAKQLNISAALVKEYRLEYEEDVRPIERPADTASRIFSVMAEAITPPKKKTKPNKP